MVFGTGGWNLYVELLHDRRIINLTRRKGRKRGTYRLRHVHQRWHNLNRNCVGKKIHPSNNNYNAAEIRGGKREEKGIRVDEGWNKGEEEGRKDSKRRGRREEVSGHKGHERHNIREGRMA